MPCADPEPDPPCDDSEELGFDQRLARLEEIVGSLEEGGLGLESALERFEEGVELLAGCRALLGRYEQRVEELSRDAEASLRPPSAEPDHPEGDSGA